MKKIDLTGQVLGLLTALREGPRLQFRNGATHTTWICRCACGSETVVETQKLRSGHTKSCGCERGSPIEIGSRHAMLVVIQRSGGRLTCLCDCGRKTRILSTNFRRNTSCGCHRPNPNRSHGMTRSREYRAWRNAKVRCYWEKSASFPSYGGRGVSMCRSWIDNFEAFLRDLGPCPRGYTLERLDVNGNYEPGNCKWIPAPDQAKNKRNTIRFNGKTIKQISEERSMNYYTLRAAAMRGEDPMTFEPRRR